MLQLLLCKNYGNSKGMRVEVMMCVGFLAIQRKGKEILLHYCAG